jgi:hypothetical protein
MVSIKRGGTRRLNNKKTAMTIPEIKSSFDKIEQATYDILRAGGTLEEQVKKFKAEWKEIFRRPVRTESAEAYLKIKQTSKRRPRNNATRKYKGKGGASPLSGAPLDHALHPPPASGTFLDYKVAGMNPPGIAMDADCGVRDISPTAQAVASAQTGGSLSDLMFRTFQTPPEQTVGGSITRIASDFLNGRPNEPSPAPYNRSSLY